LDRNDNFLRKLARVQYECGVNSLDVNAGVASRNEDEDLTELVELS
jgi:cobalamin-dependent methionine synthase I